MYVITRLMAGNKEWYSTDNTRNFWMGTTGIWINLHNSKYYMKFLTAEEGYDYLERVVIAQYLTNAFYEIEEYKDMGNHQMWVITKTPVTKAGKDPITNLDQATGKQYRKRNRSAGYWEHGFDGEFTCKFTDKNRANEVAQNLRAHTLQGKFTIAVEEVK